VGVVVVCLLPFMMVLYAAWFVWRHILPHDRRRAAWVLEEDPEKTERVPPPPPCVSPLVQISTLLRHLDAGEPGNAEVSPFTWIVQ